jgi:hypothetical protein
MLQAKDRLVGGRLIDVRWSQGDITVVTDKGTLTMTAYGDCCSSSWFESVEVDPGLEGSVVIKVDQEADPRPDWVETPSKVEEYEECIQYYFGTIYTDKGRITWEMRNSSNGYYGGSILDSWVPA